MPYLTPFDQLSGLKPEEKKLLQQLRFSPAGELLLRVLADYPPPPRTSSAVKAEHNDSYLLGARDMFDELKIAFRRIGEIVDPVVDVPKPYAYVKPPKPAVQTKD